MRLVSSAMAPFRALPRGAVPGVGPAGFRRRKSWDLVECPVGIDASPRAACWETGPNRSPGPIGPLQHRDYSLLGGPLQGSLAATQLATKLIVAKASIAEALSR